MADYWLYIPEEDEAGCVATGGTPEEALKNAENLGWYPDAGAEVQWYVLGEGGTLIVSGADEDRPLSPDQLRDKYRHPDGNQWGEHPDFPREDWQYEVSGGDTTLGYWEWFEAKIEMEQDDE